MHTTDASTGPVRGRPSVQDLSWVLAPLLELPGVTHGVILSRDGLALGGSAALPRDTREAIAAVTATILGASRALADALPLHGSRREEEEPADIDDIVISTRGGFFFLAPAAQRAALIVTATSRVDVGQIAYHVRLQTTRLARALDQASGPRTPGLPA